MRCGSLDLSISNSSLPKLRLPNPDDYNSWKKALNPTLMPWCRTASRNFPKLQACEAVLCTRLCFTWAARLSAESSSDACAQSWGALPSPYTGQGMVPLCSLIAEALCWCLRSLGLSASSWSETGLDVFLSKVLLARFCEFLQQQAHHQCCIMHKASGQLTSWSGFYQAVCNDLW